MDDKFERIYSVEFMEYDDYEKLKVRRIIDPSKTEFDIKNIEYLELPAYGPFLIRESDIDRYKVFGKGFRKLSYVGSIPIG